MLTPSNTRVRRAARLTGRSLAPKLAALLLTALPLAAPVAARAAEPEPVGAAAAVTVPGAEVFDMTSVASGRRYRIFLSLPSLPPPPGGYPALYYLDGNATFLTAAEAVRLQTRPPKGFGPAATVGVGYATDQPFETTLRYFDYTTPADPATLRPRGNGEPYPEVGGADVFLAFLEDELFPEIARRVPVDPGRRTLTGHSLGGLLTLHAFLTRPDLFATYVAGSPSIWWNDGEILGRAASFAADPPDLSGRRLFIGVGGDELDHMVAEAGQMAAALAPLEAAGLALSTQVFAGEEHITVLPALISRSVGVSLAPDANQETPR
ncbi:alpha/beta hydrolase-fold protein [Amaricoccus sp.]|uniref:alpha/beta hydrolase n=1 Tax=Amaricoccus sp. TaxID=1872485 RepID=UPI001B4F6418|nr:alpha/beta hydrolase-fold protein [Amaricoccus sp.]MBP7000712.1 alpha/beta hydrolase [Amaricoccus sp.]